MIRSLTERRASQLKRVGVGKIVGRQSVYGMFQMLVGFVRFVE